MLLLLLSCHIILPLPAFRHFYCAAASAGITTKSNLPPHVCIKPPHFAVPACHKVIAVACGTTTAARCLSILHCSITLPVHTKICKVAARWSATAVKCCCKCCCHCSMMLCAGSTANRHDAKAIGHRQPCCLHLHCCGSFAAAPGWLLLVVIANRQHFFHRSSYHSFLLARLMKSSSTHDRLAACVKMVLPACAVVDAKLRADDMVIAGPFMIFVFIGHKWIYYL